MLQQLTHGLGFGRSSLVILLGWMPWLDSPAEDLRPARHSGNHPPVQSSESDRSLEQALRLANQAWERYRTITNYSCVFLKQERINGQLRQAEFIQLKVRVQPFSVYMKWFKPHNGREVIYVAGRNQGKLLAHETGVRKIVAGTLWLDPMGRRALSNSRRPITQVGVGNLIERLIDAWQSAQKFGMPQAEVLSNFRVDNRPCWCVRIVYPYAPQYYLYHRIRVFFDKEHSLPVHFEGYDWPRDGSDGQGQLGARYTYRNLRFNQPLGSLEFSIDNPRYNFGRL